MLRPLTRRFLTYRFTDLHALNKACIQQPPAGSNSTLKLDFDLFRRTANSISNSSSVFPSAGHNRHRNFPAGDFICKPHNRSSNHKSRQQINRHRRGRRHRPRPPHLRRRRHSPISNTTSNANASSKKPKYVPESKQNTRQEKNMAALASRRN